MCVLSADTDVLLLLMDLVANNLLAATTKLNLIRIGKTKSELEKEMYVIERVKVSALINRLSLDWI